MSERTGSSAIDAAALLAEPVRRRLYELVVDADDAVGRDDAASALGIGRPLAAFHLDRLAAAGLVDVVFRRRSGRSGPGAGRPSKLYRRPSSGDGIQVSLPPRQYGVPARLFAEAIERAGDDVLPALRAVARREGDRVAMDVRASADHDGVAPDRQRFLDALRERGFEPVVDGDVVRLRNCPFDALVPDHRALTCSANLAVLSALANRIPEAGLKAVPENVPGDCCVAFRPVVREPRAGSRSRSASASGKGARGNGREPHGRPSIEARA